MYVCMYVCMYMWVHICLLEDLLPALPLGGEAGDGPHLDLHSSVELLPPHVPHSVAGGGHCTVLQQQHTGYLLHWVCAHKRAHTHTRTHARSQTLRNTRSETHTLTSTDIHIFLKSMIVALIILLKPSLSPNRPFETVLHRSSCSNKTLSITRE